MQFSKYVFVLLVSILNIQLSIAQDVEFNQMPAHLQLYARDSQDSALVEISGRVTATGYQQIALDVLRDDQLWKQMQQQLSYDGSSASFSFAPKISAGLYEYSFRVLLDGQVVAERDSIVCGDAFLINGQSNSHPNAAAYNFRSEFCRSFGRHTNYSDYNPADTTWGLSTGEGWCDSCLYAVGTWGLRLQELILQTYQMPTCVINGGSGGSSISYNLPDSNDHFNLSTTYGRLLYRATKAHVAGNVKALLWHQGESDTNSPDAEAYLERFTELSDAWRADYQPLDRIYVFQLHPANCGGTRQDYLRETQRNFENLFADVHVMATCGLIGNDGCHYNDDGYLEMARWIFPLIGRDFYQAADTVDIEAPQVQLAYFMDSQKRQIAIDFDQPVIWPEDTLNASMKDYFYLDGDFGAVSRGYTTNGGYTVILELNSSSSASVLTYLPNHSYNRNPTKIYQGPWIRNNRGVGALSFFEIPIESGPSVLRTPAPSSFKLFQNSPNPFGERRSVRGKPVTDIIYTLSKPGKVELRVYNIRGQKVRSIKQGYRSAGKYRIRLLAEDLPSGLYFYKLIFGSETAVKKMLLLH